MNMTKILLIEDALDLAALVRRELEAEGYTVRHAADGSAGLDLFRSFEPDLVLLDWMLPKLDGLTVLRRIRQAPAPAANVPVLMLTARGEETDRVIGLELGADDYLAKPFGMRELIARIHALLRRIENVQAVLAADRAAEAKPLLAGPLRLDPSGYEATLDAEPLDLTRTEFDLLRPAGAQPRPRLQPPVPARHGLGRRLCHGRPLRRQRYFAPPQEARAARRRRRDRLGHWLPLEPHGR